jgi:hypothetical protein
MKSLLVILEMLGLALAVLDFIGLSSNVQHWIDKHRYRLYGWLDRKEHEKVAHSKPYALIIMVPSWILFAWFWYALVTKSSLTWPLYGSWMLVTIGPLLLLYVLLPILYNFLLLINRSGGKTVGTVGLSIAILSSIVQRVWAGDSACG